MKPEDIVARLTPFLERETGGPVQVANVRTLTGGATREAWSLDVTVREDGAPRELGLVLLIFRPGGQRAFTAADEFRLLAATRAAGAPVPKPMSRRAEPPNVDVRPIFMACAPQRRSSPAP